MIEHLGGEMKRSCFAGLLAIAVILFSSIAVSAATPAEIDQAIERGKKFLYSQQKGDNWEGTFGVPGNFESLQNAQGGESALVLWALVACGEKRTDPKIAQGIDFVLKQNTTNVYSIGIRSQLWLSLPAQPRILNALRRDRDVLLKSYKRVGVASGQFGYLPPPSGHYDHSISQFGVLGLWASGEAGLEVPTDFWRLADRGWRDHQRDDGGWSYTQEGDAGYVNETLQMTSAGVASLFLADDALTIEDGPRAKAIERGIKWIEQHFNQIGDRNVLSANGYHVAYPLWGIERVGLASGLKYIGDIDWYERGADFLVKEQNVRDGSWNSGGYPLFSTSLAMLFLERGRSPLAFNKLQYDIQERGKAQPGKWNNRPRDIANVTRWLSKESEREMRWQIMPIDKPVAEWHEAPILYISGDQEIAFTPEQEAKLKQFVEEGGLIVGHPDAGSKKLANGFKALGSRLFKTYEWRLLPEDHALFSSSYFASKWKSKVQVAGLGNGSREFMILLPDSDPGKIWQSGNLKIKPELSELMANVLAYAVDRTSMLTRGKSFMIATPNVTPTNNTIKVARLQYQGNWNPEPYGWARLRAVLINRDRTNLDVQAVKLGDGKLLSGGFKVAHLTGTTEFLLKAGERDEIKKFVDGGGLLVIDACGGSGLFGSSMRKEMAAIFPSAGPAVDEPLKLDNALYSAGGGPKLETFGYRSWARKKLGDISKPRIAGITVKDRLGVVISGEDLSTGLTGRPVDGVIGYTADTATEIMRRVLLYATK